MNKRVHCKGILMLMLAMAGGLAAQVRRPEQIQYPPLPEFQIPQPERIVLKNGMILLLLEDRELPVVDVQARIRTGARWEPADKVGLASLTGTVMRTGGTRSMSGDELDDYLEARAASVETSIGTTFGSASMSCLKEDFREVLKVYAEVLRYPAFEEEKLQIAKNQITAGIARQNDNPQSILFREFNELIYGEDSPYARNPTYATVNAISRADLIQWHRRDYHPNRIILGLVGDIGREEALAALEEAFGDWPPGPEADFPEAPYRQEPRTGVFYVPKEDMTQSNILLGHLGIRNDNPDYYAIQILNEVLSGSFASRLFANVRTKKGLAYTVRGGVGGNWDYPGTFSMFMTTKTETTAAGIEALLEEARGLTERPPSQEEIRRAKESILNSFIFNVDSKREILGQQLTFEYYGYPLDWLARYREGIEKTSLEQVREAARRYVHPQQFTILVVGPSKGLDKPLSTFGPVQELDITIPEPEAETVELSDQAKTAGRLWLEKVLEGAGGSAAVDSLRGLQTEALLLLNTPQGEIQISRLTILVPPDKMRQEMQLPFGKITTVYSPQEAFVMGPQGTQELSGAQRQELARTLHRDLHVLLQNRRSPDFQVALTGREEWEGKSLGVLTVDWKGEQLTLLVEEGTGRVVKMRYQGRHPLTQTPGRVENIFSDFRERDGLWFPYHMESSFEGDRVLSVTVREVKVNPELAEGLFAKEKP